MTAMGRSHLAGSLTDGSRSPDGLEVGVLGCAGTRPGPGRVCSGFLFRTPSSNVVVDMGYGSTASLYQVLDPKDVDAVVLSHRHADHCVDLLGLYYALRFHPDGPQTVDVYATPDVRDFMNRLAPEDSDPPFLELCRFHDVAAGDRLQIGDIGIALHHSVHVVPTVSVRAEYDGAAVAYSADSAGGPSLVEAAHGTDLFICEASWLGPEGDYPEGVHLTASGAGMVAADAGAARLVLTHLWPDNDRDQAQREAEETFGAPVDLAEDGQVWAVRGR